MVLRMYIYVCGSLTGWDSISSEDMNIDTYQDSHVGSRSCMTSYTSGMTDS